MTGAAQGIGATIATRLSEDGWRVGVLDRNGAAAAAVAGALSSAVALPADTTDEVGTEGALDAFGAVPDLVVANAGIVRFGPLLDLAVADWRAVVDVNLTGTFVTARAAARRMVARGGGGAIVTVTSMNGVVPGPNAGAYGATKAAVALLTKQLAVELGPHGIRANAVAPGLILAGMSDPIYADPEVRRARESKVPLGRLGRAEDVAAVVAFLGSDEAAYVTGQELLVDGGVTMSMIANLPRPKVVDGVGAGA